MESIRHVRRTGALVLILARVGFVLVAPLLATGWLLALVAASPVTWLHFISAGTCFGDAALVACNVANILGSALLMALVGILSPPFAVAGFLTSGFILCAETLGAVLRIKFAKHIRLAREMTSLAGDPRVTELLRILRLVLSKVQSTTAVSWDHKDGDLTENASAVTTASVNATVIGAPLLQLSTMKPEDGRALFKELLMGEGTWGLRAVQSMSLALATRFPSLASWAREQADQAMASGQVDAVISRTLSQVSSMASGLISTSEATRASLAPLLEKLYGPGTSDSSQPQDTTLHKKQGSVPSKQSLVSTSTTTAEGSSSLKTELLPFGLGLGLGLMAHHSAGAIKYTTQRYVWRGGTPDKC